VSTDLGVPPPRNEVVLSYAPGSPERAAVRAALADLGDGGRELPCTIGGRAVMARGERLDVVAPHAHRQVLGVTADSTPADGEAAVTAALAAAPAWAAASPADRAAVFLRAADLLTGPWRARLNAATMLGQSKTVYQAEIDAACELADFWRFNVAFAAELGAQHPLSSPGVWNRVDQRPLDGFVYAVTPFNFTAIAGNLPTAPALMGNTVVWKPARTQQLAAHLTMQLLEEAGLPPGVVNMVTGHGPAVSAAVLDHPLLAGVHFTGSTAVFQHLWGEVGRNIAHYRSYPRLVGETGGKDFVVVHASADVDVATTALVRGAFEYQGQKCSAASRAYVPASLWPALRESLVETTRGLSMGPVTDLGNFMGAVIDERAFARLGAAQDRAAALDGLSVLAGGTRDDTEGYFVAPTLVLGEDPRDEAFTTEYFGPILTLFVYPDTDFAAVLDLVDTTTPYALTGSVLASDRAAVVAARDRLRFAAGNFYINDKPTGAVVGQQPFGGGRASGTNDKAGSAANLLRWTSTRVVKETLDPPRTVGYPHMAPDADG